MRNAVSASALCAVLVITATTAATADDAPAARWVYTHLLEPREHPDYDRRHVKPPSWDTFGNRTQFAALRGFPIEEGKIVRIAETIDQYTKTYQLGNVVWPSYPIVFAENLGEFAEELKRRGLFLFDIWGYVPGSGPGGYWQQYEVPPHVFPLLETTLGSRWLGMDIGEQDGRYIGGYAGQMLPVSGDRFEQYLNFQRHFERMGDELGNKLSTLVSLNFGHHFLKEGTYTTIGAETAQALPNGQVYYAFIRGAGKQYGVPWFGNASVWNRWGWKVYGTVNKPESGPQPGSAKGTSLNLLKRLLYHHILYNCIIVGFESSWFDGEALSPIGRIQQAAQEWVLETGPPGVMATPVAVMVDFFSGWSFPRHLYTGNVYRVWGNVPYGPGDHLTDGVLDMLYPGYQDASYFHDERGFISPTPYGDVADCLLIDAEGWLLARYPVLVVATELTGGMEIRDKLEAYAAAGGHLVVTAGNVAKFPGGLGGVMVSGEARDLGKDAPGLGPLYALDLPDTARVIAAHDKVPVVVEVGLGAGRVTVFASPFGVPAKAGRVDLANEVDRPLEKPFPLLPHVRAALDRIFRGQMLFEVGEGLSLVTCRKGPGEYTMAIANNALSPRTFQIASHCGPIQSVEELVLDQSEKGAAGYLPEGFEQAGIGVGDEGAIAGGDIRIFSVRVQEESVQEIPHSAPPARARGRVLPLRGQRSLKEQILMRPTFFEHFDGAAVDWRYLHDRDMAALKREAGWLERQGLRLWVDFTSGVNLYPGLRLVDNDAGPYAKSMAAIEDVLNKMQAWGAHDAVLSLHRVPENNITREETWQSFEETLRTLSAQAAALDIHLYLRDSTKDGMGLEERLQRIEGVAAPNLTLAASTALLLDRKVTPRQARSLLEGRVGLWLLSAPSYDIAGRLWNSNSPIAGKGVDGTLAQLLAIAPGVPILLDSVYSDRDSEYLDARALAQLGMRHQ